MNREWGPAAERGFGGQEAKTEGPILSGDRERGRSHNKQLIQDAEWNDLDRGGGDTMPLHPMRWKVGGSS